jgi:hypothetical protein
MNRQTIFSATLLVLAPVLACGGEGDAVVESVRFETSVTPRVYVVPKSLRESEPLFRAGLETLPDAFSGYVCLASLPGTFVAPRLRPDLKILMLNGTSDAMVPIKLARKQAELARRAVPTLSAKETEGDHFFLLSQREETFGAIREFIKAE